MSKRQDLESYIVDSYDSRFSFHSPEFGAGPVELHSGLVEVQEILSKLESNLSKALRVKAELDRAQAERRMVWQEVFDRALLKKKPGFGGDFITGKEKAAEANLAAFNEARALREVEQDASFANEAVDIIRLHYYGLDKVRQDIRKRIDLSQSDYYSGS